ncbi:MAG: hypothetical protein WAW02_12710 [Sideroxyarcus sp.]
MSSYSRVAPPVNRIGVVDSTKVTRVALENAASIAGLMLTTACMVADLSEDKSAGSMGGMM